MIYFFTPYGMDGNLGKAYNDYCQLVPHKNAWICMIDGDCMLLAKDWGHHLDEITKTYPDTGMFTCVTNRVAELNQCYQNRLSEDGELRNHRKIAIKLQEEHRLEFEPVTYNISGCLMMFRKSTWEKVGGFTEVVVSPNPKIKRNISGVDNDFSDRILKNGFDIKLMKGFYVCHYYRLIEGREFKSHIR